MGRVIRRVPRNFDWPIRKVWPGFMQPDRLEEGRCPDCLHGLSPQGEHLYAQWYGKAPFHPASTGSTPFSCDSPGVRLVAESHVANHPDFYGFGEAAIRREGTRLAALFNTQWAHHLSQEDVDDLAESGHLRNFTHRAGPGRGQGGNDPDVRPSASEVNEWSVANAACHIGNAFAAVEARCKRAGVDDTCSTCDGRGTVEAYPGQRAEADAWEPTGPPSGDGWQVWETTSEGSPVSPVFSTAHELVSWLSSPEAGRDRMTPESAKAFVENGWAPTFVVDRFSSDTDGSR